MDVGQLKDDLAIASAMNDGMGRPLHTAILRKAYEGVVALEAQRDELLAALKAIVAASEIGDPDMIGDAIWDAREAIAKARGEG